VITKSPARIFIDLNNSRNTPSSEEEAEFNSTPPNSGNTANASADEEDLDINSNSTNNNSQNGVEESDVPEVIEEDVVECIADSVYGCPPLVKDMKLKTQGQLIFLNFKLDLFLINN
jgi:hypothetical protein